MAIEKRGPTLPGRTAAADYSAAQHRFVTATPGDTATLAGDGVQVDAALVNNPIAGEAAELWGPGSVAKIEASAPIADGAAVASAANGKAKTAASGNYIVGRALNAVGADGELVSVWMTMPGRLA